MRLRGVALPGMLVAVLAGCGDDGGVKTVTEVRTEGAPTTSAPAGPTGATGTTGVTGATGPETTPTAPLPADTGGLTAVQGRYRMRVSQADNAPLLREGQELTWGAVTRCDPDCVVDLRRENENGGFKTVELESAGPTRYAFEGPGQTTRCGVGKTTATKDRTSVSIKQQRDEGGVPLATEIEGFVRITFVCNKVLAQKQVIRLRGRLQE